MKSVQQIIDLGILVHFSEYDIGTDKPGGMLQFQIAASIAEDENRTRSKSISWGIKHQAENGTSSLYNRRCYGYRSEEGVLIIIPEEAKNVKLIFDLYLKGYSVVKIIQELESRGIKSPTGKDRWCKRSIDTMFSNEKYVGDILVMKSYSSGFPNNRRVKNTNTDPSHPLFLAERSHQPTINRDVFDAVQEEKLRRSNIIISNDMTQRSNKKYSA